MLAPLRPGAENHRFSESAMSSVSRGDVLMDIQGECLADAWIAKQRPAARAVGTDPVQLACSRVTG